MIYSQYGIPGLITSGTCSLCMATSLAEFLSAYPTAGGQYHWVALISWDSWMPIISWITGWVNCSGWVALAATGGVLGSQLILGIVSLVNPVSFEAVFFLVYFNSKFGLGIPVSDLASVSDISWVRFCCFYHERHW